MTNDRTTRLQRRTLALQERVLALASDHTAVEIAAEVGTSVDTVYRTLRRLGLRSPRPPQPATAGRPSLFPIYREQVLALAPDHTMPEIATEIGRSTTFVRTLLRHEGVTPFRRPRQAPEAHRRILELAPTHTVNDIAARVGRHPSAIRWVLKQHDLTAKPDNRKTAAQPRRGPRLDVPIAGEASVEHPLSLAVIRFQRGLTQHHLAAAVGVDHSTISGWEGSKWDGAPLPDRTSPGFLPMAGRLAQALGVDPRAIIECRRILLPEVEDLPEPLPGFQDRRDALLPFVRWLRLALAHRCWSPDDLAAAVGVAAGTAHVWASGRAFPQGEWVARLAEVLDEPGLRAQLGRWYAQWRGTWGTTVRGWSPEDEATLLAGEHLTAAELGTILGRSADAVSVRRSRLRARRPNDG